ncbi:MAG: alpha/beta hydrolase [Acutalibacteraceae bacterium]
MKYEISRDFKYLRFLTFPVVKAFLPVAQKALGLLMKFDHTDKDVKVNKLSIDAERSAFDALLYEPKNCETDCVLVYFHGGGFVYNAAPYHYNLVKQYCVQTPCKVLMVDYRLAPKNKYPAAVEDCCFALRWLSENADSLKIDKSKIAVGGDSAGGNLAAVSALIARDSGIINLCGQMLVYPVTDSAMKTQSMKNYSDTYVWNSKLSKKMWKLYLPGENVTKTEYASPLQAKNLENLPKAYVETAEFDCLHDEGASYAKALEKAGVETVLYETKGTVHGYDMAQKSKTVKTSIQKRIEFLKDIFYNR